MVIKKFDIFNKTLDICKEFDRLKTIIRFQKIGLKDNSQTINRLDKQIEDLKKIIETDDMFKQIGRMRK